MSESFPASLGFVEAASFLTDELPGPLAHRLANVSAPIAVGNELSQLGPLDEDMSNAMGSAVRHLERVAQLLSALAGKRNAPLSTLAGLPVDFTGLGSMSESIEPVVRDVLDAFRGELGAGALMAGASRASIHTARVDGFLVFTWNDDGPGLTSDILRSLGRVQTAGRGGCGLGLAAVAISARAVGAHLGVIAHQVALVIPTTR